MCNLIIRSFANCEPKVVVVPYKVCVRPIREYCCVVYSHNFFYLTNLLEMSTNILRDVEGIIGL